MTWSSAGAEPGVAAAGNSSRDSSRTPLRPLLWRRVTDVFRTKTSVTPTRNCHIILTLINNLSFCPADSTSSTIHSGNKNNLRITATTTTEKNWSEMKVSTVTQSWDFLLPRKQQICLFQAHSRDSWLHICVFTPGTERMLNIYDEGTLLRGTGGLTA